MPADKPPEAGRDVYRSAGSVILWWIWAVFAVAALVDLALHGRDHLSLVLAALVLTITGVIYACALRPRVVADAGGITVLNPFRDYRMPWGAVDRVDIMGALRVHCIAPEGAAKGKIVYSWAVQASPRSVVREQGRAHRAVRRGATEPGYGRYPAGVQEVLARTPGEQTAHLLNDRAQRERADDRTGGQPETRWAWPALAAMAVPAVVLLVMALI
ncbi:MAG TPA: PH domain-containing protein [Streptosporangiaceae bacterium]